ncbi:Putative prophage CPS-53 integrase [Pigmentiphaga humi]|uniref:Prophage CPS-53 integrase n=1 Tax=Pigmentiphaga humi TaxID=2478468 RepID=A0A3P4B6K7_9BURK|nr:Putative prophage CPS-53 integrase [Pigmentiphaga humi]
MENDVFPWLGKRPITAIDAPEILIVLKRIDGRGARHTAHKVRSKISLVFRFGIKEGLCKSDPARDLVGAIPSPKTTHFALTRVRLRSCAFVTSAVPSPNLGQ